MNFEFSCRGQIIDSKNANAQRPPIAFVVQQPFFLTFSMQPDHFSLKVSMSESPDFSLQGDATLPHLNGEFLFEAPWEARVFAIGVALHEQGFFTWPEFQQQLIAEIKRWETHAAEGAKHQYYERWFEALQTLMQAKNLCAASEIETRTQGLCNRPAGYDHPE